MAAILHRLSTAGAATIVAVGVVTAPPPVLAAAGPRHVDAVAVQLQASLAEAVPPGVKKVITAAAIIALTPVWYAAFPVTLPLSIAGAGVVMFAASGISGNFTIDPLQALVFGAQIYAVGPLLAIQAAISALAPTPAPAPAAVESNPAPRPAAIQPRKAHRSVGGPRRPATSGPRAQAAATGMPADVDPIATSVTRTPRPVQPSAVENPHDGGFKTPEHRSGRGSSKRAR